GAAIAPVMPFTHLLRDHRGRTKAKFGQRVERLRVILRTGKDEPAGLAVGPFLEMKERVIMPLHGLKRFLQRGAKFGRIVIAEENAEAAETRRIFREKLRLLVIEHLQAMFKGAEEIVGVGQLPLDFGGNLARFAEFAKRRERCRGAQVRIAPALDQLLRLAEKLDLADAAAADLDIVSLQRDFRKAFEGMDLRFDRLDILDRREIHRFAPDEGDQETGELLARRHIAGNGAGLDHGGALPVLALAFVIDM